MEGIEGMKDGVLAYELLGGHKPQSWIIVDMSQVTEINYCLFVTSSRAYLLLICLMSQKCVGAYLFQLIINRSMRPVTTLEK